MKKVKVLFSLAAVVIAVGGALATSAAKNAPFVNTIVRLRPNISTCERIDYCTITDTTILCSYTIGSVTYPVYTNTTTNCVLAVKGHYTAAC